MQVRIAATAAVLALAGLALLFWLGNRPTGEIVLDGINGRSVADVPGTLYVFARFTNNGGPEWLNGAESSEASKAVLFSPVDAQRLPIPAGASPSLAEDGAHIRLFGIKGDLEPGRLVPVRLKFENAGEVRANVKVGSPLRASGSDESGIFGISRVLRVPPDAVVPEVSLRTEKTADGWRVHIETENFEFSAPEAMMTDEIEIGTGHGHLYLSGLKLGRLYGHTFDLGEIVPGTHEIRVILVTDDHRALETENGIVTAAVRIEVE